MTGRSVFPWIYAGHFCFGDLEFVCLWFELIMVWYRLLKNKMLLSFFVHLSLQDWSASAAYSIRQVRFNWSHQVYQSTLVTSSLCLTLTLKGFISSLDILYCHGKSVVPSAKDLLTTVCWQYLIFFRTQDISPWIYTDSPLEMEQPSNDDLFQYILLYRVMCRSAFPWMYTGRLCFQDLSFVFLQFAEE